MPEGDSVYRLAHRMQFMVGRVVLSTSIRVPQYAVTSFDGSTVQRVWPYGKHLFMDFDGTVLQTHLKMEGTWAVHRLGARWRKPGYTARVVLTLSDAPSGALSGYSNVGVSSESDTGAEIGAGSEAISGRRSQQPIEVVGHELGLVRVFPLDEYERRIAYLGPDVLGDDWESSGRNEARRRLLADLDRPIGLALLDQKVLAGVGNEYRAEVCFLGGFHPATPVGSVDVDQVLDTTRRLMWTNRLSPVRVTTGIKKPGQTSFVFGRNHQPCRRCGTPIRKGTLVRNPEQELERIIWWCPNCQPMLD